MGAASSERKTAIKLMMRIVGKKSIENLIEFTDGSSFSAGISMMEGKLSDCKECGRIFLFPQTNEVRMNS